MPGKRWARVSALAVTGMLVLLSVSAYGQLGLSKLKKSDEEKEQKREEKAEKERVKEAKQYDSLSEYAQNLYASDPDFHDAVERLYKELQGEHALEAYTINTSPESTASLTAAAFASGQEGEMAYILYNNPRIQDYVNRIGQELVPPGSEKLYAFRVTVSPVPYAYTLSTGSVYVSTGLISMTDNEAQLAYILSHEIAHVAKDHWKMKTMDGLAEEKYYEKQEKKRALWGALIGGGLGAAVGGAAGRSGSAVAEGAVLGSVAGALVGALTAKRFGVDWNNAQENEADSFALQNTLNRNYDVQEVPKLYETLNTAVGVDQRVGLGFVASPARIKERLAYAQKELQTTLKTDYEKKLNAAQLVGTSPNYGLMMADLNRDNGIVALQFDMFSMARRNLAEAVSLRTDDARAHLYYGRVLKQVGRTEADLRLAKDEIVKAIKLDELRHVLPGAELERALMLMDTPASQAEAVQALKSYIEDYQASQLEEARFSDSVPSNMDVLYDYLRLLGEPRWKPTPSPEYVQLIVARSQASDATGTIDHPKSDSGRKRPVLPVIATGATKH